MTTRPEVWNSRRRVRRRFGAAIGLAVLGGCAWTDRNPSVQAPPMPLPDAIRSADVVMLGEVHDNPGHHALRARWLAELAAERRFVLAMEQFDVDRQAQIDAALAEGLAPRVLAERAGFRFDGWEWAYYEPAVTLARDRGLPLRAANLPGREAMRIARAGVAAGAGDVPEGWGAAEEGALAEAVRQGHCGLLPEAAVSAIVAAQRARDRRMAEVIADARRHTGLPVVLLAGNGHVRRDLGVPRWLAGMRPTDRVVSVGLLERSPGSGQETLEDTTGFDVARALPAATREDPCEALKREAGRLPKAGNERSVLAA
jgi:uncharacterized iron-regulated protein